MYWKRPISCISNYDLHRTKFYLGLTWHQANKVIPHPNIWTTMTFSSCTNIPILQSVVNRVQFKLYDRFWRIRSTIKDSMSKTRSTQAKTYPEARRDGHDCSHTHLLCIRKQSRKSFSQCPIAPIHCDFFLLSQWYSLSDEMLWVQQILYERILENFAYVHSSDTLSPANRNSALNSTTSNTLSFIKITPSPPLLLFLFITHENKKNKKFAGRTSLSRRYFSSHSKIFYRKKTKNSPPFFWTPEIRELPFNRCQRKVLRITDTS